MAKPKIKRPHSSKRKQVVPTADAAAPHDSDANANDEGKMEEVEGDEGKEAEDEGTSFNNTDKKIEHQLSLPPLG